MFQPTTKLPNTADRWHMEDAASILEGVDLAWWPTLLRSLSEVDEEIAAGDAFTTSLHEFAILVAGEDMDAFEEFTLP